MDLFGEKPAKLLSKLVTTSVQPIDVDNFVYHIPGIEAYGEWLVLFSSFQKLIQTLPPSAPLTSYIQNSFTTSGFSLWMVLLLLSILFYLRAIIGQQAR